MAILDPWSGLNLDEEEKEALSSVVSPQDRRLEAAERGQFDPDAGLAIPQEPPAESFATQQGMGFSLADAEAPTSPLSQADLDAVLAVPGPTQSLPQEPEVPLEDTIPELAALSMSSGPAPSVQELAGPPAPEPPPLTTRGPEGVDSGLQLAAQATAPSPIEAEAKAPTQDAEQERLDKMDRAGRILQGILSALGAAAGIAGAATGKGGLIGAAGGLAGMGNIAGQSLGLPRARARQESLEDAKEDRAERGVATQEGFLAETQATGEQRRELAAAGEEREAEEFEQDQQLRDLQLEAEQLKLNNIDPSSEDAAALRAKVAEATGMSEEELAGYDLDRLDTLLRGAMAMANQRALRAMGRRGRGGGRGGRGGRRTADKVRARKLEDFLANSRAAQRDYQRIYTALDGMREDDYKSMQRMARQGGARANLTARADQLYGRMRSFVVQYLRETQPGRLSDQDVNLAMQDIFGFGVGSTIHGIVPDVAENERAAAEIGQWEATDGNRLRERMHDFETRGAEKRREAQRELGVPEEELDALPERQVAPLREEHIPSEAAPETVTVFRRKGDGADLETRTVPLAEAGKLLREGWQVGTEPGKTGAEQLSDWFSDYAERFVRF